MSSFKDYKDFWSNTKTRVIDDRTLAVKAWRMLDQEGEDRDFVLGETRPWVIGFYDRKLPDTRWSAMMDLTLISGAPTQKQTAKPSVTPKEATIDDEGVYSLNYPFTAIDGKKDCTVGTQCSGWTLTGEYEVSTTQEGESSISVEVKVTPPKSFKFNLRHRFGVTWSLEYADSKIESFIAYY
jgi:hypothetical protein